MKPPCLPVAALLAVLLAVPVSSPKAAGPEDAPEAAAAETALRTVHALRQVFASGAAPESEDAWQRVDYRGRPSLEVKGRVPGADGAPTLRDVAIVDLASGRVASFVWFPGASRRRAGEAILPMSEASVAADARIASAVPGIELVFVGIQRYRGSGEESVYYEVGYAPQGEVRHPEPLVRLLLDASTGAFFRLDVDAGWYDPLPPPTRRISESAARRIATVVLRPPALERAFGPGARAARLAAEGLYFVRPSRWPADPGAQAADEPRRHAWGVSFAVEGAAAPGQGVLFVDATTGKALGGAPGPPP